MKRPVWVVGAVALLVTGLTGLGSPAAQAQSGGVDPVPGLPVYLALGDSIANGQASAPEIVDYATTVAGWRANGYVAQFDAVLKDRLNCLPAASTNARTGCKALQVVNLARSGVPAMDGQPAKPGVTTQTVIDEQLPVALPMLRARNHDANPRNDVEVVTLTVGGNDIFGPITSACLASDRSGCPAAIQTAFAAFSVRYATILAELRAAAGPNTPIITMTYYNPLPYCYIGQANPQAGPFANWFLEGGTLPGFGTLPAGFNDLIRGISAANGAKVADTFGTLGAGDFVGGTDCLHPVRSGHTKIAADFTAAMFG
ncbi:SGNH/GDSL hydrolase family protein [Terrabacter carboxydivorans]|uniref:SGNH hydrolase-type esterase domain-containing protein n=1 Tax=Terrabacter carboxydivorans TaxID=619730 RepID=A0ABN3M3D0_9MICO